MMCKAGFQSDEDVYVVEVRGAGFWWPARQKVGACRLWSHGTDAHDMGTWRTRHAACMQPCKQPCKQLRWSTGACMWRSAMQCFGVAVAVGLPTGFARCQSGCNARSSHFGVGVWNVLFHLVGGA